MLSFSNGSDGALPSKSTTLSSSFGCWTVSQPPPIDDRDGAIVGHKKHSRTVIWNDGLEWQSQRMMTTTTTLTNSWVQNQSLLDAPIDVIDDSNGGGKQKQKKFRCPKCQQLDSTGVSLFVWVCLLVALLFFFLDVPKMIGFLSRKRTGSREVKVALVY